MGALKTAAVNEIDVPEDLSLVGFGNHPMTEFLRPALTNMSVELTEMGSRAAHMLNVLMQGKRIRRTERVFPLTLVERQSVRPPRGKERTA